MPTIRDIVPAIAQREEVEAAILLGRDGLLIDARAADGVDVERLAAHVPSILGAADELGRAAGHGAATTAVVELEGGMLIVSSLSAEAILLVLVRPGVNVGPLLFEVRRHRGNMASLV